jgi:hypothetical protein
MKEISADKGYLGADSRIQELQELKNSRLKNSRTSRTQEHNFYYQTQNNHQFAFCGLPSGQVHFPANCALGATSDNLGGTAMPLPVKLQDVVDALELTTDSNSYFLDKRTGEIEMITEEVWSAAEDDELISNYPEWQRELILKAREIQKTDHFIQLPDKFEIAPYEIMERFCVQYPNRQVSEKLLTAIKGKAAFSRFKDMISNLGIQGEWNRFERQAFEDLAVEWLEDEEIPFTRGDEIELSTEF